MIVDVQEKPPPPSFFNLTDNLTDTCPESPSTVICAASSSLVFANQIKGLTGPEPSDQIVSSSLPHDSPVFCWSPSGDGSVFVSPSAGWFWSAAPSC